MALDEECLAWRLRYQREEAAVSTGDAVEGHGA